MKTEFCQEEFFKNIMSILGEDNGIRARLFQMRDQKQNKAKRFHHCNSPEKAKLEVRVDEPHVF